MIFGVQWQATVVTLNILGIRLRGYFRKKLTEVRHLELEIWQRDTRSHLPHGDNKWSVGG